MADEPFESGGPKAAAVGGAGGGGGGGGTRIKEKDPLANHVASSSSGPHSSIKIGRLLTLSKMKEEGAAIVKPKEEPPDENHVSERKRPYPNCNSNEAKHEPNESPSSSSPRPGSSSSNLDEGESGNGGSGSSGGGVAAPSSSSSSALSDYLASQMTALTQAAMATQLMNLPGYSSAYLQAVSSGKPLANAMLSMAMLQSQQQQQAASLASAVAASSSVPSVPKRGRGSRGGSLGRPRGTSLAHKLKRIESS